MIRPFQMKDLSRVLEIWLNSSIDAHPFLNPTHFLVSYEKFQKDHLLKSQSTVYELDGEVIGFISIKQTMELSAINIDTKYQNNGFGEKLLDHMKEKFALMYMTIFSENTNGFDFLVKNGFEVVETSTEFLTKKKQVTLRYENNPLQS